MSAAAPSIALPSPFHRLSIAPAIAPAIGFHRASIGLATHPPHPLWACAPLREGSRPCLRGSIKRHPAEARFRREEGWVSSSRGSDRGRNSSRLPPGGSGSDLGRRPKAFAQKGAGEVEGSRLAISHHSVITPQPLQGWRPLSGAIPMSRSRSAANPLEKRSPYVRSAISNGTKLVDSCIAWDVSERPPAAGVVYKAFTDPSGGSNDAMTLAIGHAEGDRAMLDVVRERKPPFSPDAVVEEFCSLLKQYGITSVTGDRYAGEWPRERFRVHGIEYVVAEKTRSEIYRDLLPGLNSGTVELLDVPRLADQLCNLERRVVRGGRESIDHPPGGHDDLANSAGGVLVSLRRPPSYVYGMLEVAD